MTLFRVGDISGCILNFHFWNRPNYWHKYTITKCRFGTKSHFNPDQEMYKKGDRLVVPKFPWEKMYMWVNSTRNNEPRLIFYRTLLLSEHFSNALAKHLRKKNQFDKGTCSKAPTIESSCEVAQIAVSSWFDLIDTENTITATRLGAKPEQHTSSFLLLNQYNIIVFRRKDVSFTDGLKGFGCSYTVMILLDKYQWNHD